MRTVYSFAYLFGICGMTAALAGCSQTASPATPSLGPDATGLKTLTLAHTDATTAAVRAVTAHRDLSPSWLSPDVSKKEKVLWVSDAGTGDVYLFKLPALKHAGTITGFDNPQGVCSDDKGNVWITNLDAQDILEYSHEGVIENTLTDSTGYPAGCAWDPMTGNLAVTNLFDVSSEPGAVLVYPHASGSPTAYRNKAQETYYFAGYDAKGNLFFDGRNSSATFVLSELPKGAAKAHSIEVIGGTIDFPGTVQWYATGNYLIVGDQLCGAINAACLYHITIAHNAGTIAGRTNLKGYTGGNLCDLVQGTQYGTKFFGSDYNGGGSTCTGPASTTYMWAYPAGKDPSVYTTGPAESTPIGAAVSK
jgi:hypothetical protein